MNTTTQTPAHTQPRPAAKHTEGPWKIKKDRFSQSVWAGNERIAEMMGWGKDRRRANARLIAAAPELLSALRRTLDALEIAHEYASKTAPALACVKWAETEDAARAAIAQAEGGAQ